MPSTAADDGGGERVEGDEVGDRRGRGGIFLSFLLSVLLLRRLRRGRSGRSGGIVVLVVALGFFVVVAFSVVFFASSSSSSSSSSCRSAVPLPFTANFPFDNVGVERRPPSESGSDPPPQRSSPGRGRTFLICSAKQRRDGRRVFGRIGLSPGVAGDSGSLCSLTYLAIVTRGGTLQKPTSTSFLASRDRCQ